MQSCDTYMLSTVLSNTTFADILLSCGISNGLYRIPYGGRHIYGLSSRNFTTLAELLERLGVEYRRHTVDSLASLGADRLRSVLVSVPSTFVEAKERINTSCIMPAFTYSTYAVSAVEREEVFLTVLVGNTENDLLEKSLTFEQMEKISGLKTIPDFQPLSILELTRESPYRRERTLEALRESLRLCMADDIDEQDGVSFFSGRKSYGFLCDLICQYDGLHRVVKTLLYGSIGGGSMFFHRREFADALTAFGHDDRRAVSDLRGAGNKWRTLARILSPGIGGESINQRGALEEVQAIEELELSAFERILRSAA